MIAPPKKHRFALSLTKEEGRALKLALDDVLWTEEHMAADEEPVYIARLKRILRKLGDGLTYVGVP